MSVLEMRYGEAEEGSASFPPSIVSIHRRKMAAEKDLGSGADRS